MAEGSENREGESGGQREREGRGRRGRVRDDVKGGMSVGKKKGWKRRREKRAKEEKWQGVE